jgi:Domain of unknown function (DUF4412)
MKFLFTLIIALFSLGVQAQVYSGDEIKDKTEDAAENKVNNEIDNTINNSVDKGFNALKNSLFKKKKKKKDNDDSGRDDSDDEDGNDEQQENYSNLQKLYGINNVEINKTFEFDISTDILLTSTDENGKKEEMAYTMLFPNTERYFAMDMKENSGKRNGGDATMIFDIDDKQMITLTQSEGQKMGFVMPMDFDEAIDEGIEKSEEKSENVDFRKTGKTKTILGYVCDQYVFSDEEGSGEFWIARDESLRIGFAMTSLMRSDNAKSKMPENMPAGGIMEMNYKDNDGSEAHWITTAVNKDPSSISTAGYQFMSIGGK